MHVAQAALLWASGDPEGAMLRLLSAQHRTPHPAANTTAPSAGGGVTPTGTGQQSNVREAGSGAGDVDPFALDFLLRCGLYRLAGKAVPADLAARLAGLARGAAAALGEAGLPGAALEALLAAARLTKAQPQGHGSNGNGAGSGNGSHGSGGGGASGAGGHIDPDARAIADARDYERLLAAALAPRAAAAAAAAAAGALHSSEDGIRSGEQSPTDARMPQHAARQGAHAAGAAHSTTPGASADGDAGAAATAAAAVAAAVRPVLQGALQAVDGVLDCTPGAVLAALVAHAAGTVPADEWPLLPPPHLRHPPSTSLARSPGQQAFGRGGASAPIGAPGARAHPRRSSHDAGHHPSRSPPGASAAGSHRSHHQGVAQQGLSRRSSTSQPPTPGSSIASGCSSTAALTTFAPLFEEALEVISVEGDKCFAATCSGIITPDGHGRPFAVATGTSS